MTDSPVFSLLGKSPEGVTVTVRRTMAPLVQAASHLAQPVCRQVCPLITAVVGLTSLKRRARDG